MSSRLPIPTILAQTNENPARSRTHSELKFDSHRKSLCTIHSISQRRTNREETEPEEAETRRKREKEPTFLEKQAKEGLMSRCGTKDREDTVFMEKAAGAATATATAAAETSSRVNPIQEKRKTKIGKEAACV